MADDFDDLDEAEGGPQPAEDRKLVIVDLGHRTIVAGASRRCLAELLGALAIQA
jgi:hypothetical protein